jgi:hypothetical protein
MIADFAVYCIFADYLFYNYDFGFYNYDFGFYNYDFGYY